jgi:hypothetical protein
LAEKKPLTGMPCEEFTTLASGGFEGKIGFRDRLRMLWHRIECVYCRRFLAQLKKIKGLLKVPPPPDPMPAAMRKKIHGKLQNP